jgi:DNA-binding transcriptional MerR regulator
MDGTYSIGELARRTGLTVKAIRLYSDRGIVLPIGRTAAGHRRYGPEAVARLALVHTLRELGFGLAVIRRVLARERTLGEVAAKHAAALDAVFHGLDADPAQAAARQSMTPELPSGPTGAQVDAWVELAELTVDPEFRSRLRRMAEQHATDRAAADPLPRPDVVALARDLARPAVAAGIAPDSPAAEPAVAALTGHGSRLVGRSDGTALRRWLLERLDTANDPRRDRYLELLARINGWAAPEPLSPLLTWSVTALRHRTAA